MPVLVIESSELSEVRLAVPEGGRLLEVCEAENAPIFFSCRSANCGTCRVDVLEGAELLEPPSEYELDVLDRFGDLPEQRRLACQACLKKLPGVLRLRQTEG